MKKSILVVVGLALLAGLVLAGCTAQGSTTAENGLGSTNQLAGASYVLGDNAQQTGIWVSGTGEVSVVPDVAILLMGVEAQEASVSEAQSEAADAMNEVMAALASNGVASEDIQTQWYSIAPATKWIEDTREEITIGYRVSNTVRAKIRNIESVGTIIDAVAGAGGDLTRVSSISFTVDDPDPYYDQAREEALADAMDKAEQIAQIAGVGLGKPFYISETGGVVPPRPYPAMDYGYAEGAKATTPISAGEIEISLTVQMAYSID
jgi:uncharacterized protein YggE